MPWLKDLSKVIGYLVNPAGVIIDQINAYNQPANAPSEYSDPPFKTDLNDIVNSNNISDWFKNLHNRVNQLWDDFTGKSQIVLQNELDREMAEEEYQRNLQSIGDTASAYEAAGFNRNLMYNQSPAQYNAPQLTAYSGTKKLDHILQNTSRVLSMIPAMYQATAALEAIDQARERTKQSEIKTMSMGMSLLDQGYKQGQNYFRYPFIPSLYPDKFSNKRHFTGITGGDLRPEPWIDRPNEYYRYSTSALKNTFDLLESIGIKNQMNSTLNNWRGYQYSLDRRFGAAGRIVGMGTQAFNAAAKFFTPIKFGR